MKELIELFVLFFMVCVGLMFLGWCVKVIFYAGSRIIGRKNGL